MCKEIHALKSFRSWLNCTRPTYRIFVYRWLPTVVNVSISCGKNMFSYEICRSVTLPIHANTATSLCDGTSSDLPVVVQSVDTLKGIDQLVEVTFKYALLQGDNMFLNALDSGLIILDLAVEFLSVETYLQLLMLRVVRTCWYDFIRDMSNACSVFTSVQAKTTASHRWSHGKDDDKEWFTCVVEPLRCKIIYWSNHSNWNYIALNWLPLHVKNNMRVLNRYSYWSYPLW